MNSTDDAVLMAMDGGVLTVTLNSPRVRNALIDGIEAGLARAAKEGQRIEGPLGNFSPEMARHFVLERT